MRKKTVKLIQHATPYVVKYEKKELHRFSPNLILVSSKEKSSRVKTEDKKSCAKFLRKINSIKPHITATNINP